MDYLQRFMVMMLLQSSAKDLEQHLIDIGINATVKIDVKDINLEKFKAASSQQSQEQESSGLTIKVLDSSEDNI